MIATRVWRGIRGRVGLDGGRSESPSLSLGLRLDLWRRGFASWSGVIYDLARNDPSLYLPDAAFERLAEVNGETTRAMLRNKLLFALTIGRCVPTPEVFGLVERGEALPLGGGPAWSVEGLLELSERVGGLVLKPVAKSSGRGVTLLEVGDGGPRLDGRAATPTEVRELVGGLDGFLVVRCVRNAAYAARVFPDATNSIRVVVIRDPEDGEPHVMAAVHRFGTRASVPTDNAGRGGLSAPVDLATGRLRRATDLKTNRRGRLVHLARHPDTGAAIEGMEVPGLLDAFQVLFHAHRAFPNLRYVGWDLVLTESGPMVIEANHCPSRYYQRSVPLLGNERMRRFLEHHGVV